jgi:dihydrofolate reductase
MLALVAARGRNGVIGAQGRLPWRLPTDMRQFRELTTGGTVLMGRKTFESLPPAYRPLPDRRNVVVSRRLDAPADVEVYDELERALDACERDCFVIGGGEIYAQTIGVADRLYLTEVAAEPEGDSYFPPLDEGDWRCVADSGPVRENGHEFNMRVYDRAA